MPTPNTNPTPTPNPAPPAPQVSGAYKYNDDPTVFGNYNGNTDYGFHTADEFTKAGGNFGNVAIRQRPTSTPAGSGPTATPAGLGLSVPVDPNQTAIDKAQSDATSGYTAGAPDQETIRQNTLKGFQTQLDALDQAAATARADITTRYTKIGNERLGSNRALLAGAGMLGQVSGDSSQNQVTDANTQETSAAIAKSDADFTNQKNALLGQARTMAVDEYNNKLQAYTQGANATVQYLRDKTTRAKENAVELAKSAIAKGINLADPKNANDLKTLAQQLGMSPDALIATYTETKAATDAAKLKAAKDSQTTLAQGSKIVDANGKVIADNPAGDKFSAAKDAMGNPLSFNSTTGKYTDLNGNEVTSAAHTGDGSGLLDAPSVSTFLTGKSDGQIKAFNTLSDVEKSSVMQLVNGDALLSDLMASRGIQGSAARQQLLAEAKAVDPTFSENANKQRYTFKTEWNNPQGRAYVTRDAINTGLGHLAELKGVVDQLNNGDFQKATSLGQFISKNINGSNATLVAQFQQIVDLLAPEIAKVYAGGVPDKNSIDEQRNAILAMSPKNVQSDLINLTANLMGSKLDSTAQEYKNVMGGFPDSQILHTDVLDKLQAAGINTQTLTKSLIQQGMKASSIHDYVSAFPDKAATAKKILTDNPNLSDEDVLQILQPDFSSVGGDTNSASSVVKTVAQIPNGQDGGQCGHFVNQLTGLGLGDSYQSKISKMDPSIKTPQAGMVFVMPYKDNGHTGIILAVNNGIATVKDSNYSLDGKIKTHQIPVSKMTGFAIA